MDSPESATVDKPVCTDNNAQQQSAVGFTGVFHKTAVDSKQTLH